MSPETPEQLSIEISSPADQVVLVRIAGEMDILSVGEFAGRMAALAIRPATHVAIDISGLGFIDSSGMNALVQAVRSIEDRGGSAVLAAPSPGTQRVFAIARLAQVVPVEEDLEAALVLRRTEREPGAGDGSS